MKRASVTGEGADFFDCQVAFSEKMCGMQQSGLDQILIWGHVERFPESAVECRQAHAVSGGQLFHSERLGEVFVETGLDFRCFRRDGREAEEIGNQVQQFKYFTGESAFYRRIHDSPQIVFDPFK